MLLIIYSLDTVFFVTITDGAWCSFAAISNLVIMNFPFSFYQKMKHDLSPKAYIKAFEIAKWMEWHPRNEWASIVRTACNNRDYIEGQGIQVETWFNNNLLFA